MVEVKSNASVSSSLDELVVVLISDIVVSGVEVNSDECDPAQSLVTLELNNPLVIGAVLAQLVVDDCVGELDRRDDTLLANEEPRGVCDVEAQRHGPPLAGASDGEGVIDLL